MLLLLYIVIFIIQSILSDSVRLSHDLVQEINNYRVKNHKSKLTYSRSLYTISNFHVNDLLENYPNEFGSKCELFSWSDKGPWEKTCFISGVSSHKELEYYVKNFTKYNSPNLVVREVVANITGHEMFTLYAKNIWDKDYAYSKAVVLGNQWKTIGCAFNDVFASCWFGDKDDEIDMNYQCYGKNSSDRAVCYGYGVCVDTDECMCFPGVLDGRNQCQGDVNCNEISIESKFVCTSHGTCQSNGECLCDIGYDIADDCNVWKCGNHSLNNETTACNGMGVCEDINDCQCNPGYYSCALSEFAHGDGCPVYIEEDQCKIFECFGMLPNRVQVCGSHGTCVGPDTCECRDNYDGEECLYCKKGYNAASGCAYKIHCFYYAFDQKDVCSTHGSCNYTDQCVCNKGWYGKKCELDYYPYCFGKGYENPKVCSERGECKERDYCKCNDGYSGKNCEFNTRLDYVALYVSIPIVVLVVLCCLLLFAGGVAYTMYKKLKGKTDFSFTELKNETDSDEEENFNKDFDDDYFAGRQIEDD